MQPEAVGKVRYKSLAGFVAGSAGAVLRREGSPGASAAAPALPWGVRYGVTSAGRGLQKRGRAVPGCAVRIRVGVPSARGHAGDRSSGAGPAREGARGRSRRRHRPRVSGTDRATWQGRGLESPVCFLSLQIIQCFIPLENIRKCLPLARLERGRGVCFGVVGRALCFEVVIAKFVAQKKFM